MSDFAALRDKRKAKDTRSMVNDASNAQTSSNTQPEWPIVPNDPYDLPDSVEIRASPTAGRTLFARADFAPGAIIMSYRPHVHVLSTAQLKSHCSTCCKALDGPLMRCSKCLTVYYCSTACQTVDWTMHKAECSSLRVWARHAPSGKNAVPGEAIRCLGRILRLRESEGSDSLWIRQMSAMQSLRGNLPRAATISHANLVHALTNYLGISEGEGFERYGISSAGDLVRVVSQFTCNSFTVSDATLAPIGVCIAPSVALANHSCAPNAVVVFPRPTPKPKNLQEPIMQLIAIAPIRAGEEILTSYIDTSLPRVIRRRQLLETYNFTCACTLCTQAGVDPRSSARCPLGCGGLCALPDDLMSSFLRTPSADESDAREDAGGVIRCAKCRAAYDTYGRERIRFVTRIAVDGLEKATELELSNPARAQQWLVGTLHFLNVLPHAAHPRLAELRMQFSLLLTLGGALSEQEYTIASALRVQRGLQDVFPEGHPVRAIALAELGKLLAMDPPPSPPPPSLIDVGPPPENDGTEREPIIPPHGPERLALALSTLHKALSELRIGFGAHAEVTQNVEDMVRGIEREMEVWHTGMRNVHNTTG